MPKPDKKAYKGWRGTIRAALTKHPDKFSKAACKGEDPGKLCPYAVFTQKKKEGEKPHYEELPHTTKGTPKKKKKYRNESFSFAEYVEQRDLMEAKRKKKKMIGSLHATFDIP
ncbi:MAG: hypothetical protein GTO02_09000 [Candidatus Dadabacteria bacterium]|nr:hypothetical protein [Candidatus Dadabacteria bacterium]